MNIQTMSGFENCENALNPVAGIEAMNMIWKRQVEGVNAVLFEIDFIK